MGGDKGHDGQELEHTRSVETDGVLFPNLETGSKELEEHRFVEQAFLSTNGSLYRVPGGPGVEEHSTL